jgi:hypothetical protein
MSYRYSSILICLPFLGAVVEFCGEDSAVLLRCIGGSKRWSNYEQKGKRHGISEEKGNEEKG